jgi:hypothetical protein
MNRLAPNPFALITYFAAIIAFEGPSSLGQATGAVELHIERGPYYTFISAAGAASTNLVLLSSTNLTRWTTVYQSIGWPGTNPVYYAVPQPQPMFWTAIPGESFNVQQQRWTEHEPAEYTFYLRYMISFWDGGVRGTVRVRNGQIVAVTGALDDRSGQPISNPDLTKFLTIDQVFAKISGALQAGAQQVQVNYDATGVYPVRVYINPEFGVADIQSLIEVSDYAVVKSQ